MTAWLAFFRLETVLAQDEFNFPEVDDIGFSADGVCCFVMGGLMVFVFVIWVQSWLRTARQHEHGDQDDPGARGP